VARAGCGRLSPRAGCGRADISCGPGGGISAAPGRRVAAASAPGPAAAAPTFLRLDLNFNANRRGPARTTTQAAKALPVPGPVTQALRLPRGRRRPIFLDLNFDANRLVEF